MYSYLNGNGGIAQIEKEAEIAVKSGFISASQVDQIKTALEIGKATPNFLSKIKSFF